MSHHHRRNLPPQLRQRIHHEQEQIHKLTNRGQTDPSGAELYDDLYTILFSFGNLAAAASATQTQTVPQDSRFEWMRSTWFGNLHGATPPFQDSIQLNVNIFITDSGSGRQLMSAPVPIPMIAGLGKLPFINPTSRIFNATSTIQCAATNFDGASQFDNIFFAMIGRKIYRDTVPANLGM